MSFVNVAFADDFFETRAFADNWKTSKDKSGLLNLASRLVDKYCQFYDEQGYPISYINDENTCPDWLKEAVCEEALYLANIGKDPTQPDDVTVMGISSTKGTVFDRSMKADILCVQCRVILTHNGGEISPEAVAHGSVHVGRVVK